MPEKPSYIRYRTDLIEKARDLRANATAPERTLWRNVLSRKQLCGFKFVRQKPLGAYIVDFYCAQLRLAVEVDGETHADQEAYDAARTAALAELGVAVIRFTNTEVMSNLEWLRQNLVRQIETLPLKRGS